MTRDKIDERLKALQAEYEAGQRMLAELESKRSTIASTLLRIEGAMQVLREMVEGEASGDKPG